MKSKITIITLFALFTSGSLLSQTNRVGINTTTPKASLDVNYKVRVDEIDSKSKNANTTSLFVDNDGFLSTIKNRELTFAYMDLNIATQSVPAYENGINRELQLQKATRIKDFNTRVPAKSYNMIILYAGFSNTLAASNESRKIQFGVRTDLSLMDPKKDNEDHKGFAPQQYYEAFVAPDGNWHIKADYAGLRDLVYNGVYDMDIEERVTYFWNLPLLFISNYVVQNVNVNVNLTDKFKIGEEQGPYASPDNFSGYKGSATESPIPGF